MFKSSITAFMFCLALSLSHAEAADIRMPGYAETPIFYKIGGGNKLGMRGGVSTPLSLSLNAKFGLGLGCGKFDPKFAIENTLNQLEQRLTNLTNQIQTAVAALPGYIICRAAPQLCQLMQNYTVRSEELINIAMKSCQEMDADLAAGRDPLEDWIKIGRGFKLKVVGSTTGDVFEAVEAAKKYDPNEGLRWVGGKKAGGLNQPAIRPVSDTVRAGYNTLLGRSITNGTSATGTDPLINLWPTPEQAAKWTAEVVGEVRPDINHNPAQTSVGGATSGVDDGDGGAGGEDVEVTEAWLASDASTPGLGLDPKIRKEAALIEVRLSALVAKYMDQSTPPPTAEEMSEVGGKSGSVKVTPGFLSMISQSPVQDVIIPQMAWEMAVSNVALYAMEAKRMLVAGRNTPDIAAFEPARKEIDISIARMEKELDALEYERNFYSRNSNQQALMLLEEQQRSYDRSGAHQKTAPGIESSPFQ